MTFLLRRHSTALRPIFIKACLLALRHQRACARNSPAVCSDDDLEQISQHSRPVTLGGGVTRQGVVLTD